MGLQPVMRISPLLAMVFLSSPAFATVEYTKQLRLPCGQCHVNATGDGISCLNGQRDKIKGTWAVAPKPMWECSHSPGGTLTPLGQRWLDDGHAFK